MHHPKREVFDVPAGTNTDPKAIVREVAEFRTTTAGLYMARTADHPHFDFVESWLLPELDLRITDFHFTDGHERAQEFYVDVMTIDHDPTTSRWHTVDLYLDIICCQGSFTEMLDIDEFVAATSRGLLSEAVAYRAMVAATRALSGITAHNHDVCRWLRTEHIDLTWRRH